MGGVFVIYNSINLRYGFNQLQTKMQKQFVLNFVILLIEILPEKSCARIFPFETTRFEF